VRWGWLALPIVLALLTFVVLVATVYFSSCKSDGFVWKSSSLAVLFHGLIAGGENTRAVVDSTSAKAQTAKAMEFILDREGDGCQLAIIRTR
jgi:hypothetical protein